MTADDKNLVARLGRWRFLRASNVAKHRIFLTSIFKSECTAGFLSNNTRALTSENVCLKVLVAAYSLLVLAHVHLV